MTDVLKITLIGGILNLFLIVIKLVAGLMGNSLVLIADAFHSLSDLASDVIVFLALKISQKPKDDCHQFGHGKFETLASLLICVILSIITVGIFRNAIFSIANPPQEKPKTIAIIAAMISIILKEILFRVTHKVGKKNSSDAIILNAWHHRSDALSSFAALIGISGSMAGFYYLDPIAAIIVGILIGKIAIVFGKSSIEELLEKSASSDVQNQITEIVKDFKEIKDFHKMRTRKVGSKIFCDLHILIDPEISIQEGHKISERLKEKIILKLIHIDVIVHIEPFKPVM